MWGYKHLIPALLCCLACGCNPAKLVIDFDESKVNKAFFSNVADHADSIILYKTSFREKYVENEHTGVLEFSNINVDEDDVAFKYLAIRGDSQDIYLARFITGNKSQFIYFSAKYGTFPDTNGNPVTHCKGFGPAYYGSLDNDKYTLDLTTAVKVNKNGTMKKKAGKNNPKPVFILSTDVPITNQRTIQVSKIMFGEYNKYGGKRPVIMPVSCLLKHSDLLYFQLVKPITQ